MYLFIDPSSPAHITLGLVFKDHTKDIIREGKNRELLQVLVEALDSEQIAEGDIQGIAVLVGVGGFSSTRIASVVGNGFAYALQIPIIGVAKDTAISFGSLKSLCDSAPAGVYLSPTYSGEPNIGKSS
jgi:tRNA A37 threonylcarbamoyladenosine modification protein TsaB